MPRGHSGGPGRCPPQPGPFLIRSLSAGVTASRYVATNQERVSRRPPCSPFLASDDAGRAGPQLELCAMPGRFPDTSDGASFRALSQDSPRGRATEDPGGRLDRRCVPAAAVRRRRWRAFRRAGASRRAPGRTQSGSRRHDEPPDQKGGRGAVHRSVMGDSYRSASEATGAHRHLWGRVMAQRTSPTPGPLYHLCSHSSLGGLVDRHAVEIQTV